MATSHGKLFGIFRDPSPTSNPITRREIEIFFDTLAAFDNKASKLQLNLLSMAKIRDLNLRVNYFSYGSEFSSISSNHHFHRTMVSFAFPVMELRFSKGYE